MRREPLPLFRRALRETWRSLFGWMLGVAAALVLYLPLFPSMSGSDMQGLLDSLPPELVKSLGYDQIGTGPGYTQSTFYGLIGYLMFVIAATSWGTAAIAGDEENGSLELTAAHGVSRTRIVLERTLALAVRLLWLAAFAAAIVIALNERASLQIDGVNLLAASAALFGLTLVSGVLAVAVGAATGRRVFATAAGAGIAVIGYAFNAIANQNEDLEWMHSWSPYAWAYHGRPLSEGADWGGLGLLFGASAVLVAVAVAAFARRDLST